MSGEQSPLFGWDGDIPCYPDDLYYPVGDRRPEWEKDENLKKYHDVVARYDGKGYWYIEGGPDGLAVVLINLVGKRLYIVAKEYLYGEEPPRRTEHSR